VEAGKTVLEGLLVGELVEDDPDDAMRLGREGGALMQGECAHEAAGFPPVNGELGEHEDAEAAGEDKDGAGCVDEAIEAGCGRWTPADGQEDGTENAAEEEDAVELMRDGREVEGVEGLANEPGGEEKEASPDDCVAASGSAGQEKEADQDEPEEEEIKGDGEEEVPGRAAPMVESLLLRFYGRLDDPHEKERGEAHGHEEGSHQGGGTWVRSGV
jgi:hypothetical protein